MLTVLLTVASIYLLVTFLFAAFSAVMVNVAGTAAWWKAAGYCVLLGLAWPWWLYRALRGTAQ